MITLRNSASTRATKHRLRFGWRPDMLLHGLVAVTMDALRVNSVGEI